MRQNYLADLDTPLLRFSECKEDCWTIRDAVRNTFIVGAAGSGKTSGSGKTIAHAFLNAGFGGLVLCAKNDEADTWRQYAKETGRENSLIVMDGSGKHRFNFLDYEIMRDGDHDKIASALEVLLKINQAISVLDNNSGSDDNPFWQNNVKLLFQHTITALYRAYGRLSIDDLLRFIRSMPKSLEESQDLKFVNKSFCMYTLFMADDAAKGNPELIREMAATADFFEARFSLDTKTRTNLLATIEGMLSDFTRGTTQKLFCTDTTITPEMCQHGAVIVLDLPIKVIGRGGGLAQHIFKFAYQRAIERRRVDNNTRPCFLWVDEAQLFLSEYDKEFLSTVRSSRCCTVYLTQSIPAIRTKFKQGDGKDSADELLNNFQTRIIHYCQDDTTRTWAADTIGKTLLERYSENEGYSEGESQNQGESINKARQSGMNSQIQSGGILTQSGGVGRNYGDTIGTAENIGRGYTVTENKGRGTQQVVDYELLPSFFGSGLRTGGDEHRFIVDGVVIRGGKLWHHSGKPYLACSFEQASKDGNIWKKLFRF